MHQKVEALTGNRPAVSDGSQVTSKKALQETEGVIIRMNLLAAEWYRVYPPPRRPCSIQQAQGSVLPEESTGMGLLR